MNHKKSTIKMIVAILFILGAVSPLLLDSPNAQAQGVFKLAALPAKASPGQVESVCGSDPAQVGCWLFNEGSGTTTADGSGNGNTGTLYDSTMWTTDRFGNPNKALHFNGTTQYVKVPDAANLNITGDITIVAWVKPETVATQDLVKKAVMNSVNGYELSLSSATGMCISPAPIPCAFARFNQAGPPTSDNYRLDSMTTYTATDPWTQLAVTYTAADNTIRLYKNGALSNSRVPASTLTIATNSLFLGFGAQLDGTGPIASRFFTGSLDEIRLYKRALSAAEIKALYLDTAPAGFTCTPLQAQAGTANTGEKPQSKVWYYQGKWWSVFPASGGAWLWRLDGTAWTPVLNLSTNTSVKADVKPAGTPVGSVVHVLLYDGANTQLASVEYNAGVYQAWSGRPGGLVSIALTGSETATIDIDSTGRMWLATQHDSGSDREMVVYHTVSPYNSWNGPITLATVINNHDDISVVTALPNGTVGVLWSNQTTQRFGFKYHKDSDPPSTWSVDEVPASQSALNVGGGMADDHLNVAVDSNGTLYAAVKTSYDTGGNPKIALLVRRLSGATGAGVWDDLYNVDTAGTRGIVLLDEATGVVTVIYTSAEGTGDILYKQSSILQPISLGAVQTMRSGSNNDASSTKQNINGEMVTIYSNGTTINGSLCTSIPSSGVDLSITKTDGKTSAKPGDASTYTIVVANNSASPVTGATVADTFPAALTGVTWSCSAGSGSSCTASGSGNINDTITLAANGSVTYTANATIASSATGSVVNTATVTPPNGVSDPNTANNTATDSTTLTPLVITCGTDPDQVGCWLFEEGSGTTTADGSGNVNTGTLSNSAMWTTDRFGNPNKALHFNGAQYVRVADSNSLDITSDITIAVWVKPEVVTTQDLVKKAVTTGTTVNGYELDLSTTGTTCQIDGGVNPCAFGRFNQASSADNYRIDSTTAYTGTDPWTFYVVTYTSADNTLRLFKNGALSNSRVVSALTIATNNLFLGFGAQLAGTGPTPTASRFFTGSLDDIRIFKRALNADEISALYNQPTAVILKSYGAEAGVNDILVNWQTLTELGVVGFNVYRADAPDGLRIQLNQSLINAKTPGRLLSNSYQYQDRAVISGKTYYYWIEVVMRDGSTQMSELLSALAPYWFDLRLPMITR